MIWGLFFGKCQMSCFFCLGVFNPFSAGWPLCENLQTSPKWIKKSWITVSESRFGHVLDWEWKGSQEESSESQWPIQDSKEAIQTMNQSFKITASTVEEFSNGFHALQRDIQSRTCLLNRSSCDTNTTVDGFLRLHSLRIRTLQYIAVLQCSIYSLEPSTL